MMAQDTQVAGDRTFVIPPPPEDPKTSLLSNVLAVAGFIIIIIIVIWGLVHLANLSRGWFSSFFGTTEPAIAITVPETAISGQVFTISWKYEPPVAGTYSFLYQCIDNVQFRTPDSTGALIQIPCGVAYTTASNDSALPLVPFNPATSTVAVPLSIIFLPSGEGERAQGSDTVAVEALSAAAPSPTSTPTPSLAPSPTPAPAPAPRPITPADLSVRIQSVYTDASGMTTATFEIANIGGISSGVYYFTAQLPTTQYYPYTSSAQRALGSGDRIVNTLRFTQLNPNGGTFTVHVDPYGSVRESNKTNNFASYVVNVPTYYNYYSNYQQYYSDQQYPSPYVPDYSGTPYSQYYPYAY